MADNTYAADLAFLSKHTDIVELGGGGDVRVAVAPAYQGRVMTSTLAGGDGVGFGWLNKDFIASGVDDPTFNNYGGEDRFWVGPEAGQFGLWYKKGEPFDVDHWTTPAGFNSQPFELLTSDEKSAAMATRFEVTNYSGIKFSCQVRRTINLLDSSAAEKFLGIALPAGLAMVGCESDNKLTNAGDAPWTRETGLLSIWILGQYKPLARGKVIVPIISGDEADLGPGVDAAYYAQPGPDRLTVGDDHVMFACDGKFRSKIGISPARAKSTLGSYDPDGGVLTIVQFTLPADAAERPYVNSKWEIQVAPFAGDVINSYNDGEATPGAGQLGPFYELETSSPAAGLAPGESISHAHRTFHFAGEFDQLNTLSKALLSTDLGVFLAKTHRPGLS